MGSVSVLSGQESQGQLPLHLAIPLYPVLLAERGEGLVFTKKLKRRGP